MITRLKLKNWRSHLESEFKFSKGVNALIGIMGSGKSSVMDAMCFALFGTFPALQQRKLKLDDIIRSKPNQAQSAAVELDFIKDNEVYTVYREIGFDKGTKDVELRRNGELLDAENSQAVNEHIEKILHADYDIFSRAVYAEQNQLDYFLELPKGQRMAQIDNLLKLDRYETARKNVTTLINKLDYESEAKNSAAKSLFSSSDSLELEKLQKNIADFDTRLEELNAQLTLLAKEREKTKKELESGKATGKIKSEIEKIDSEKRGLVSTLDILIAEIEAARKISALAESTGLKAEKDELNKLKEIHGSAKDVSAKMQKLKDKELELSKKIERNETKTEYLGHALKDIEIDDNCPLCKTKLKASHKEKLKSEHSKLIEELQRQIFSLKKELNDAKKEYYSLESIHETFLALEETIKDAEKEQKMQQKHAAEKASRAKELEKKKAETEKKLRDLEKNSAELSKKLTSAIDVDALEAKFQELILNEEKIRGQISSEKALAKERQERISFLEKKKQDYEALKKDAEWLSQTRKLMELFSGALLRTQETLREEFIKIVNEVMSEVWPTLYPYGDIGAVKLEVENRDYVLKARTTTEWVNVEGITSGGERSLAALALRIAFSLALARNLGMLVLDEPTHNLDTNAVDELAITLRERLPNLIDQIFLITHEERLESAVSGYLYRLERNKELDEPTKVNLIASPEF